MRLRTHQRKILDLILASPAQHTLVQGSTGIGKSVIMAHHVARYEGRTLVLAPKRKLVRQLVKTFAPLRPAWVMGSTSHGDPATAKVVICTYQTANARLKRNPNYFGDIEYVVVDEAHISFELKNGTPGKGINAIHKAYWNDCKWFGYTATPIDMKGRRMEGWEHTVSHKYNTAWLIEHGWLARYRYFTRPAIDTSDLQVQRTGDYKLDEINEAATKHVALRSTLKWWRKFTDDGKKKNMIFAASIEHAKKLVKLFDTPCAIVHSQMTETEQEEQFDKFADPNDPTNTLVSVSMLTEGFDDPAVEVAVYARPTASIKLAFQMAGRVLRQHKDKDAVIVDLAGVYENTGVLPDMPVDWNKPSVKINPSMLLCIHCGREFERKRVKHKIKKKKIVYKCPHCGEKNKVERIKREGKKKKEYIRIDTLEEVKKLSDIDLSALELWSNQQYIEAVNDLIKKNTRKYHYSGNYRWARIIMGKCVQYDKETFRRIMRGPFAIKRKWSLLMDLLDASKGVHG